MKMTIHKSCLTLIISCNSHSRTIVAEYFTIQSLHIPTSNHRDIEVGVPKHINILLKQLAQLAIYIYIEKGSKFDMSKPIWRSQMRDDRTTKEHVILSELRQRGSFGYSNVNQRSKV